MDRQQAVQQFQERLGEIQTFHSPGGADFAAWKQKTDRVLSAVFGEQHRLVEQFRNIRYRVNYRPASPDAVASTFRSAQASAVGILSAAIYEKEELEPYDLLHASFIDPDLWEHVKHLVEAEQWAQVASQTAIYVESRTREWGTRPSGEVGEKLMTAVFGPESDVFPLGKTNGERHGWHRLAMGFAMALRNVDTHRIQKRPDLKRYAFGVLGAGSLILTQLRFQYGTELLGGDEPAAEVLRVVDDE